jgi:hypothetical protein
VALKAPAQNITVTDGGKTLKGYTEIDADGGSGKFMPELSLAGREQFIVTCGYTENDPTANKQIFHAWRKPGYQLRFPSVLPSRMTQRTRASDSSNYLRPFTADGRPDLIGNSSAGLEIFLGGSGQPTVNLTQLPASPFDLGQTVSLMTGVSPDPPAFQPSAAGTITLADGGVVQATKPLVNGTAYFVTPYVPRLHNFTAAYAGDARNANAVGTLKLIQFAESNY